jgi:hypothetical protein
MSIQELDHLKSKCIDDIGLLLDEDVYGANGDLSDEDIIKRLVLAIKDRVASCGGGVPGVVNANVSVHIGVVAALIFRVWAYGDRQRTDFMSWCASGHLPLPDEPPSLTRS